MPSQVRILPPAFLLTISSQTSSISNLYESNIQLILLEIGDFMESVILESNCLATIISSTLEVYNRETNGFLLSRPKKAKKRIYGKKTKIVNLSVAFPFQTDKRAPTWVWHGNAAATNRVIDSLNSMGVKLIGGYHSHVYPNDVPLISDNDIEHIKDEMERINNNGIRINRWLELIVAVKRKDYITEQKIGYSFKSNDIGIKINIKTGSFIGFDIRINGYWLYPNGNGVKKRRALVYTKHQGKYF